MKEENNSVTVMKHVFHPHR